MFVGTLVDEVIAFAESLPYWAKYLAEKILSGIISDIEIDVSYSYLLEDADLKQKTTRDEIILSGNVTESGDFIPDILLNQLKNIEGVNALVEKETIEFNPMVTVIFGANGSGKTGYVRLLKKVFFSRADEDILHNIYTESGHKTTSGKFIFKTGDKSYTLKYPDDKHKVEFRQFAVFDNKCASTHLNEKNNFEFRPAGLEFFVDFIQAIKKVESKLTNDIEKKKSMMDYDVIFDGESDIKNCIQTLNEMTNIEELKKHLPFTEEDEKRKKQFEENKAELQTLKKDKEIKELEDIKKLVEGLIESITSNNLFFTKEKLSKVQLAIKEYVKKENLAKKEGVEQFTSLAVKNIGGPEWKAFIQAAEIFAKVQGKEVYPEEGDICILCQQPLSKEAQKLITSYWEFIKSTAEAQVKVAQNEVNSNKKDYEVINFALIPNDTILYKWLNENYTDTLETINKGLKRQKELSENIITDMEQRVEVVREQNQIDVECLNRIINDINQKKIDLIEKDPTKEIEKITKEITYITHKEKLENHITKIEEHLKQLKWVAKANKIKSQLAVTKITNKEKELSDKYFSKSYIDVFNEECKKLDADFGIEIKHTGSLGSSFRQLKVKGNKPSEILSEGEQKVISMADFLSEIRMCTINRGIVFDDPVNSLDEERKSIIAKRFVQEAKNRQVIVFTHDLVFLSCIISYCDEYKTTLNCHWMEKQDGKPGTVWLNNTPSFEKSYRKLGKAQEYCDRASKCGPEERESNIKNGFAALRTSYEALVIFDLFGGVVQRFNERVSLDSLRDVVFNEALRDEVLDGFYQCCRYMEGHAHSDKYAYKKPEIEDLRKEISRFSGLKSKIKECKKTILQQSK